MAHTIWYVIDIVNYYGIGDCCSNPVIPYRQLAHYHSSCDLFNRRDYMDCPASATVAMDGNRQVARVTGLEPATSGVTGRRSNQLSYTRLTCGGGALEAVRDSVNLQIQSHIQFHQFFVSDEMS